MRGVTRSDRRQEYAASTTAASGTTFRQNEDWRSCGWVDWSNRDCAGGPRQPVSGAKIAGTGTGPDVKVPVEIAMQQAGFAWVVPGEISSGPVGAQDAEHALVELLRYESHAARGPHVYGRVPTRP